MPTGGIGYNPRKRHARRPGVPSPKPIVVGGYTQPPALTYDPAIEAERRAAGRGLEDIEVDLAAKEHFATRDLSQALRDIRTRTSRSRNDLNRSFARGQRRIGEQGDDVRLKANRANQDFDTQIATIGRQFAQLGQRQRESNNAAGVLGGGTEAAAQVARARNQGLAEAPIQTARERVGGDLATALRRLGTAGDELLLDRDRELAELHSDRDRERRLAGREFGREMFGMEHELERARREKTFTDADSVLQEIYQARANRPGAFSKTGQRTNKRRRR